MSDFDKIQKLLNQKIKIDKSITSTELGKRLGVSQPAVHKWLNGGQIDLSKIHDLCIQLEVTPNMLFDFPDYSPTKEELELLKAYAAHPEYHDAIKTLLNLK